MTLKKPPFTAEDIDNIADGSSGEFRQVYDIMAMMVNKRNPSALEKQLKQKLIQLLNEPLELADPAIGEAFDELEGAATRARVKLMRKHYKVK